MKEKKIKEKVKRNNNNNEGDVGMEKKKVNVYKYERKMQGVSQFIFLRSKNYNSKSTIYVDVYRPLRKV